MYALVTGDSASELKKLPTASAVAIFADPPAGLRMSAVWDVTRGLAFCELLKPVFAECRRILKPGHWSLTWAHPKTAHWTAVALELSGFEIVTSIIHLNPEAKPASPGLPAPGHEFWILARVPGPVVPLNVRAWTVQRHPRTVVLGSGYSKALDALIGARKSGAFSGKRAPDKNRNTYGAFKGTPPSETPRAASLGGPSRFFPSADDLITIYAPRARQSHRALYPGGPHSEHPTPKSLGLVLPLLDLITGCVPEPNGLVVDPVMGSGSTGAAAAILDLDFWGCDRDPACAIEAEQRLTYWSAPS
jgi:hypothetical protein